MVVRQFSRSWMGPVCGWIMISLCFGMAWVGSAWLVDGRAIGAPAPSRLPAVEVRVHLGTEEGALQFVPDTLAFQAGQRYTLVLDNPSPQKHYFTSKDFADNIWSQKVEAAGVEVKGAIHELELKPGAEAEWVFVPLKPGTYELHCSIAGHREAGMVGQLTIDES